MLQPTQRHFYDHCQNSNRNCPNNEFCIIKDSESIYNIVTKSSSSNERGQGSRSHDLYR